MFAAENRFYVRITLLNFALEREMYRLNNLKKVEKPFDKLSRLVFKQF